MKKYRDNLRYLLRYKWFVLRAGLSLKVPLWRLVVHDWTKLSPAEFGPYADRFFGKDRDDPKVKERFQAAWRHHWAHNDHHPEYWDGPFGPIPMREAAVREMVADWHGAGMAQGKPDTVSWYLANWQKLPLHPLSRVYAEKLLGINMSPADTDETVAARKAFESVAARKVFEYQPSWWRWSESYKRLVAGRGE